MSDLVNFCGIEVEREHINTYDEMCKNFNSGYMYDFGTPKIINCLFKHNDTPNKKIPKKIIIYIIEYYVNLFYKFRELICNGIYYMHGDDDNRNYFFKKHAMDVSNLLYVLKLPDDEYEDYKKTLEILGIIKPKEQQIDPVVGEVVKKRHNKNNYI